jgi:CHAD domain-containing protein
MSSDKLSLQATTPVTVAARMLLSRNLKRTWRRLRLAVTASQNDIEHVHRLRISTRQSLAALEVFREYLPARRAERVVGQLNEFRQIAAQARDFDVMIQKRGADSSPDRKLLKRLRKSRRQAQEPIVAVHDLLRRQNTYRQECRKLLKSLDRFDSAIQPQFSVWANRKLAISQAVFLSQSPADVTDLRQLHRFRIAAKKFRYTLEILQPAFQGNAYELVMPDFKRLQDLLGSINDHAVAITRIRLMKKKGYTIDDPVLQRENEGLDSSRQEFAKWWTPETAGDLQQKLKSLIIHQELLAPHGRDSISARPAVNE